MPALPAPQPAASPPAAPAPTTGDWSEGEGDAFAELKSEAAQGNGGSRWRSAGDSPGELDCAGSHGQESSLWSAATVAYGAAALKQEPDLAAQPKWARERLGPAGPYSPCHARQRLASSRNAHAAAAADHDFDDEDLPGADSFDGGASSSDGGDGGRTCAGGSGANKSRYRGVSFDKKKRKWRVQIKVATLGKSGVSVGYYDTEEAAARAYDRAAIGLLGRDSAGISTNFALADYDAEAVPQLIGKTREEVKATLRSERAKVPRRRISSRQRTSKFMGVGSSNRKNQWQARILVHGKVTHLGYYETEEGAARVYDRVSLSLHGPHAQTNFPAAEYAQENREQYQGLNRQELQRALGVKPMDKSSRYRGVSKKKGRWEAKVMVNRKWAYRELFDSEREAARAYDAAVWRLKPGEAKSYVNFKDRTAGDDSVEPLSDAEAEDADEPDSGDGGECGSGRYATRRAPARQASRAAAADPAPSSAPAVGTPIRARSQRISLMARSPSSESASPRASASAATPTSPKASGAPLSPSGSGARSGSLPPLAPRACDALAARASELLGPGSARSSLTLAGGVAAGAGFGLGLGSRRLSSPAGVASAAAAGSPRADGGGAVGRARVTSGRRLARAASAAVLSSSPAAPAGSGGNGVAAQTPGGYAPGTPGYNPGLLPPGLRMLRTMSTPDVESSQAQGGPNPGTYPNGSLPGLGLEGGGELGPAATLGGNWLLGAPQGLSGYPMEALMRGYPSVPIPFAFQPQLGTLGELRRHRSAPGPDLPHTNLWQGGAPLMVRVGSETHMICDAPQTLASLASAPYSHASLPSIGNGAMASPGGSSRGAQHDAFDMQVDAPAESFDGSRATPTLASAAAGVAWMPGGETAAAMVRSASVSALAPPREQTPPTPAFSGQPAAATPGAAPAPFGAASGGLLAGLADSELEAERARRACGSPLKGAVQIGGEDLSMFDDETDDAGGFLLDPDLTPADA
ncbi:hypothetical protein WJX81_001976 [Elliptochloris bilobata]|uniref:AP2/ERF domain-containing protein n=1 Tax=Elliptochloris bilobata TaxID=381761 RepID=A0AAW1RBJ6_9CHLO